MFVDKILYTVGFKLEKHFLMFVDRILQLQRWLSVVTNSRRNQASVLHTTGQAHAPLILTDWVRFSIRCIVCSKGQSASRKLC